MFVSQWKMGWRRVWVDLPRLQPDDGLRAWVCARHEGGGYGERGEGGQRGLQHLAAHHGQGEVSDV